MENTIEGRNPVLEALKSGRPINKILLVKNIERHGTIADILYLAQKNGVFLEYVDRQVINRLGQSGANQGIIALTAAKDYIDLDELLLKPAQKNQKAFFVILDGLEDPHNLGAIIRTADAAGAHGIIIRERRAVGLTAVVEKASAGAIEYVPVARVTNISKTIETLKNNNVWVVGIDQAGKDKYSSIDYRPATAIVIGAEGQGLSDQVRKSCDFLASIPMHGHISSLNASVAAAVVMYEVAKQRN